MTQPRDPANSFYLLAGPTWHGGPTRSCLQYKEQVAVRKIHLGITPAAEIHDKEVAFQRIAKTLKENQSAQDSFAAAAGVQVAVPAGGDDDAGTGGGLDDAADSDGEDLTGIAAIQITADAVLSSEETAGPSSGGGTAGKVPTVIPFKRPPSSLQTPSDTEFEEFFTERGAVLAGKRGKSSTPKSRRWIDDSESSQSATSGDEAEEETEAVHKGSGEDGGSEGSGMDVDDEESATEEVVAGSSLGETEVPRGSVPATEGGDQVMDVGNNNEVGSVDNEYAVLPGQQNHMAIGI